MYRCALLILAACAAEPTPFSGYDVPPVPATEPVPDFADVFTDAVPEFRLELTPEAMDALRLAPRERVDATFHTEAESLEVRVRLKGNGSFQPVDDKPSLKVRFEEPWLGMKTLILNNTVSDPSRMSEFLAAAAYQRAGVPAARAGHAWVELDGVSRGLYTALEDVDDRMLEQWFDDGEGSLYEMADGDFTADLLGGIEHEEGPEVPEALQQVVDALALGDAIGFDEATGVIDRQGFLRYTAVTAVVAQTDAYPYSRPGDDVYLYRDPASDRFHFLPHGLDEAFQPRDRTLAYLPGLLARRCLANASCREELAVHVLEVFERLEPTWTEDVAAVQQRVAEAVGDERIRVDPETWAAAASRYPAWLVDRRAQLETELDEL